MTGFRVLVERSLTAALLVVAVANFALDFAPGEGHRQVLHRQRSRDLLEMSRGGTAASRYDFYLQFRRVARGRPLVAPRRTFLRFDELLGLSGSELLIEPSANDLGARPTDHLLGRAHVPGVHRSGQEYAIVTEAPESGGRFRAFRVGGVLVVVHEKVFSRDSGSGQAVR